MKSDFFHFRMAAGISREHVRRLAQVSERTARRWDSRGAPRSIYALVWLAGQGRDAGPAWRGWRFSGGLLVSPEGDTWTPAQLRAWWIERQLLAELRRRVRLSAGADAGAGGWNGCARRGRPASGGTHA